MYRTHLTITGILFAFTKYFPVSSNQIHIFYWEFVSSSACEGIWAVNDTQNMLTWNPAQIFMLGPKKWKGRAIWMHKFNKNIPIVRVQFLNNTNVPPVIVNSSNKFSLF